MNYAVWVLILLCCGATNCPVKWQCFYALFTLRCKIETSLGVFLQLFLLRWRKRKEVLLVLASDYVEKVSSFYVCSICLRNLLYKLKGMKKNVKQKAGFRCCGFGNVSWNQCLFFFFTRINNEQSSIVSKISIYLATYVTIYFIR